MLRQGLAEGEIDGTDVAEGEDVAGWHEAPRSSRVGVDYSANQSGRSSAGQYNGRCLLRGPWACAPPSRTIPSIHRRSSGTSTSFRLHLTSSTRWMTQAARS